MNSAWMISNAFSSLLLGIWDVKKEAFEKGDLDGMVRSLIQGLPLVGCSNNKYREHLFLVVFCFIFLIH